MTPRTAALPEEDLCQGIVNAALSRFLRFGYNKTTMAEIADDTGMSAANLYRYFDNKQDIATACCAQSMAEGLDRLRRVVDSQLPLQECLEKYAFTMINTNHELATADSKIGELVAFITRNRAEIVLEKLEVHYSLIEELLKKALQNGEIRCPDICGTAKYIYSAFAIFDVPLFVGFYSKHEYERRAKGIVDLVINGLKPN